MRDQAHTRAITALGALGPMRVWSLLVTVFGDLAPDDPLDGPTLSVLMEGIGIKPEATRVALHRLRAEGWITSQKKGRISAHKLTPKGRQDSESARPRIYGRPKSKEPPAKVILTRDGSTSLDPAHFVPIGPRLFVCAGETRTPSDTLDLAVDDIPHWLGPQIEPPGLLRSYDALYGVLNQIVTELNDPLTPPETAMLRVMIVHAWRRLVLKHPNLPRNVHSPQWREHDCRVLVAQLLDRFERPALDQVATQ